MKFYRIVSDRQRACENRRISLRQEDWKIKTGQELPRLEAMIMYGKRSATRYGFESKTLRRTIANNQKSLDGLPHPVNVPEVLAQIVAMEQRVKQGEQTEDLIRLICESPMPDSWVQDLMKQLCTR